MSVPFAPTGTKKRSFQEMISLKSPQARNAARHRRGRNPQLARGSSKAAALRHSHEHLKGLKPVHSLFHILK